MKTILSKISFALAILAVFTLSAQERPIRIGVKIGFPNAVGGHLEYVTPLLGERLAPSVEYTSLKLDSWMDPDQGKVDYFGAGLNYYFGSEPGRGSYVHLGYGSFKGKFVSEGYNSNASGDGTGTIDISNNSLNIRIGAKAGGLFYFRPEIGYMFSSLPKIVETRVDYPDGSTTTEQEELPGILSSGLMLNIGIGFAF